MIGNDTLRVQKGYQAVAAFFDVPSHSFIRIDFYPTTLFQDDNVKSRHAKSFVCSRSATGWLWSAKTLSESIISGIKHFPDCATLFAHVETLSVFELVRDLSWVLLDVLTFFRLTLRSLSAGGRREICFSENSLGYMLSERRTPSATDLGFVSLLLNSPSFSSGEVEIGRAHV